MKGTGALSRNERSEPQKTALMGQWSFFSFAKKKTEPKNKIIIKKKN